MAELRHRHPETHILHWGTAAKRAGQPLTVPLLNRLHNIPACGTYVSHPPRTLTSSNVPPGSVPLNRTVDDGGPGGDCTEVAGDKGSDTVCTDEVADTHGHTRVLACTVPGNQGTAVTSGSASAPYCRLREVSPRVGTGSGAHGLCLHHSCNFPCLYITLNHSKNWASGHGTTSPQRPSSGTSHGRGARPSGAAATRSRARDTRAIPLGSAS